MSRKHHDILFSQEKIIQDNSHYTSESYNSSLRFLNYWMQFHLIQKYSAVGSRLLEIGVGSKVLTSLLKKSGVRVTTLDVQPDLLPDVVGDVQSLVFLDDVFDVVCCFEVLEHVPFRLFHQCLSEISRVSKGFVLLSFPMDCLSWELGFKGTPFGLLRRNHPVFGVHLDLPRFWKRTCSREHYWELGNQGFSLRRVRRVIQSVFNVVEEIRVPFDGKHRFFVCEVKA